MATIKATCPMCGDVDLTPRQVHVRVVEAIEDDLSRRTYTFGCPQCHEDVEKAADAEAIRVFVENIRELLMSAPLGQKKVLSIDPGFRTGCKLAVLDAQGKLLFDDVIYPTSGSDMTTETTPAHAPRSPIRTAIARLFTTCLPSA